MNFNVLDLVLVAALLLGIARGFVQGALSQVAAFGGAVAGLVVGASAAPWLARQIVNGPGVTMSLVSLGLLLVLVLLGQAAGLAVGLRIRRAAALAGAAPFDRAAGMVVGAAGLILVVWLFSSVLAQGPSQTIARQVQQSAVVGLIDAALPPPPDVFGEIAGYLDQHGFPQVFAGPGGPIEAEPVPPTSDAAVQSAAAAGQPGTVQVQATGCRFVSSGSGFATRPGFVVTNAHVVAGSDSVTVRDGEGTREGVVVHFDAGIDVAVVSAPGLAATPVPWATSPAGRGVEGATLGFPGGARSMTVRPATVVRRGEAMGRDIYGRNLVSREILTLSAGVQQGDSGGPFVTSAGQVGGVVFGANAANPGTGYALTAEQVRPAVDAAIARNSPADTGRCRF